MVQFEKQCDLESRRAIPVVLGPHFIKCHSVHEGDVIIDTSTKDLDGNVHQVIAEERRSARGDRECPGAASDLKSTVT